MESRVEELEKRIRALELRGRVWPDTTISKIEYAHNDVITMAKHLQISALRLTTKELTRFLRSYQRQLRYDDLHLRHQHEALLGAVIAKHQFKPRELDGELPGRGNIQGPVAIRAKWFVDRDDWYDVEPWTPGDISPQVAA